jgi:hypothetical protein
VVTAGLARPRWVLFAGLSWRVVMVRVSGWRAWRAIVVAGMLVFLVSGRCARRAVMLVLRLVVLVLRSVVHVSRRRARRAMIFVFGSVVVVPLLALLSGCRVLLMAVGVPRPDMPRIRAGVARCGVIATAEGESGRDVLLMPEGEPRREAARTGLPRRALTLVLLMPTRQAVR